MKKPTVIPIVAVLLLLSRIPAQAHPGHPGHEYWPFEDFKMVAVIGLPLIVLAAYALRAHFRRQD